MGAKLGGHLTGVVGGRLCSVKFFLPWVETNMQKVPGAAMDVQDHNQKESPATAGKRRKKADSNLAVTAGELAAMGEWMTGEEEKATELHVVDTRSAEEKAAEAQVQRLLEADVAASA